jgi:heat shock protein HtpX
MSSRPSLAGRAIGAVLLMVGFYVLALVIAGALFAIPIAEVSYAHRVDLRPAIFCVVAGFAILRAIMPRVDKFPDPGPELTPAAQPRLFAMIADVAKRTGQAMPSEVFLVPDVNAWVAQRGGVMGFGSRRVMGIGLPLLETVTVDELRAILAHEFGHYHGGDTALGPWIYKTRAAIGRTLQSLARHSSMLMKPFEWYGIGFLRITHAISRRQEYAADALAARTVGARPMISGLRTVHGTSAVFGQYWATEVAPLVARGYQPPIAAGFGHFLSTANVAPAVTRILDEEMSTPTVNPYDTHPPLRDRIAALVHLGGDSGSSVAAQPEAADAGAPRAISLLDSIPTLESALVAHLYKPASERLRRAIEWADAGAAAWGGIWRDELQQAGSRLEGVTGAQIPSLAADLHAAAVRLGFAPHRERADEGALGATSHLLAIALAVALLERGWSVTALPGDVVEFRKDGATLTPFADIARLAAKSLDKAEWKATWEPTGILALDLGTLRPRRSTTGFLPPA